MCILRYVFKRTKSAGGVKGSRTVKLAEGKNRGGRNDRENTTLGTGQTRKGRG